MAVALRYTTKKQVIKRECIRMMNLLEEAQGCLRGVKLLAEQMPKTDYVVMRVLLKFDDKQRI